jgi:GH24 family phage-related lysozyme (muramidase)
MKYLKIFENWINEAAVTADQIAQQIQQAVGGTGTDEVSLVNAIKSIPDSASLVKVNQSLKIGVANKNWDYLSVGDAINGELGLLDQSYKDQINTHIKNIRGEQYLGSFTAPPPPVDPVIKSIQDRVIKHEGSKPAKYIDSRGNPTIGVGFNLTRSDSSEQLKKVGANPEKIKSGKAQLTQSQISALLFVDLTKAKASAQTLISKNGQADISKVWQTLPITVQGVLTEMIFNLGKNGLSEFNDFLTFITKKKFPAAAQEMLRSSWAKQVGQRANNLAEIIQSVRLAESAEDDELISLGLGTNTATSVYDAIMSKSPTTTELDDYLNEPTSGNTLEFSQDWYKDLDSLEHLGVDEKEHRRRNQGITLDRSFGGEIQIIMDFNNKVFNVWVSTEQLDMDFDEDESYQIPMNDLLDIAENPTPEEYADEIIEAFKLYYFFEDPFGIWATTDETIKKALDQHKESNASDEVSEKKRLEWHDSNAPDAKGKFKELGIQKLADWLIRTRGGNMQKITGSLNQQINFNKKKNPSYAKKMESTREAVKRKLEKRKNK